MVVLPSWYSAHLPLGRLVPDVMEIVSDYNGSVGQVLHIFNLSLCTILVYLSLIANFTLLFPKISKIL